MKKMLIENFTDFCYVMKKIGFCMSSSDDRIFNLQNYYGAHIKVHTGNSETDPWIWRIGSIKEVDFFVYGKFFFRKAGWITKDWLPQFLSVRRNGKTFDEMYQDGMISKMEKNIYDCIRKMKKISVHDLKEILELNKSEQSQFNTALTNLQMKLFITLYDETKKVSISGEPYGWPVTVFSTFEEKVGEQIVYESYKIPVEEAFQNIYKHIKELNPYVIERYARKFIVGE